MRAESSILESSRDRRFKLPFAPLIGRGSQLPPARPHVLEIVERAVYIHYAARSYMPREVADSRGEFRLPQVADITRDVCAPGEIGWQSPHPEK